MKNIFSLLLCFVLFTQYTQAQSQEEAAGIAAAYPGEKAVVTKNYEHLILRFDQGKLVASSDVQQIILLLNDLAPGVYNTANVYHSSFHNLSSLEAYSYIPTKKDYKRLTGSLLKTTNMKSENIFFDDNQISVVSFPGLVKNAYTETKYSIEHTELAFLPIFYFQWYLPTVANEFQITAPKSVHIKTILKDIDPSMVTTTVEEHKNTVTYTWKTKSIGRYKEYSNAPSSPAGLPRIIPYITDYTLPGTNEKVALISDTKSLYQFLYRYIAAVNQKEDAAIQQKVNELTNKCTDNGCKAAAIYKWVQDNIKYVAFEDSLGGFVPREAADIYQRKFGDCKDMSSLLVSMFRAAGLEAYFTWIGTRDKPYFYSEVPLPLVSNHMICAWKNEGKWIFVDGTHSTIQLGVPPYSLQGKEAFIAINEQQFEIVKVPEIAAENNTSIDSTWLRIGAQNELEGKVKICYSGYPSWSMKMVMRYSSENEQDKTIKSISTRGSNKYIQKTSSYENIGEDICFNASFGIKDYVQKSGNELYVNLNLLRYNSDEKVAEWQQRTLPIENKYKALTKQVVCLEIPKGFLVAYLPPDATHSIQNLWSYSIKYKVVDNQIICTKEYIEPMLYIQPNMFEQQNQLVEELNNHYKESIILKAK
jgi:transglutaminase-like putative cysteine protease